MTDHPTTPHDALVKKLLEAPERVGVVLRESLPAAVRGKLADADPEPLPGSYIDSRLKEQRSDRLFRARLRDGRTIYLYVLIEHKSEPDPATPVQLLGYLQRIWRRYAEQSRDGRAHRYRHLPPILPLVIYNGRPEWSAPLSLLACIDADDELLALQRDFGYQVRHLRPDECDEQYSEDPVVRSVLRALAWAYARNLNWEDLVRLLRDLPPGHPMEKPLLVYIASVYREIEKADVRRALEETRPDNAEELTMTVAEEWIQQGERRGEQKGEAKVLLWLLEDKFGATAAQRYRRQVKQADEAAIKQWSSRILRAGTVEEVFNGG